MITTSDDKLARKLRLLRNHGLAGRDVVVSLGVNSRLDEIQAIVAVHGLDRADAAVESRRRNAALYEEALARIRQLSLAADETSCRAQPRHHQVFAERRDELLRHCIDCGIECKVRYPIPLYCQEGLRHLGYKPGEFPGITDRQARTTMTLPVHQYLLWGGFCDMEQLKYRCGQFPITERLCETILALPANQTLAAQDIEYIFVEIPECLGSAYNFWDSLLGYKTSENGPSTVPLTKAFAL